MLEQFNIQNHMVWTWASDHPLLFTAIQVLHPGLAVLITVAGMSILKELFYGRRR